MGNDLSHWKPVPTRIRGYRKRSNPEDMIADSTEEIAESMGGNDESSAESDQMSLELRANGQESIEVYVGAWNFEENTDYEITMVMTDSDGITQDAYSQVVYDSYFYDYDEMSSSSWGDHCVTAQLKDVTNNEIVDSVSTCVNVPQEPEASCSCLATSLKDSRNLL